MLAHVKTKFGINVLTLVHKVNGPLLKSKCLL